MMHLGAEEHTLSIDERVKAEERLGVDLIEYAGRWVAVQDHRVVDDDDQLERLVDRLNGQRETAAIFKVRERPNPTVA
jgi:hypothetical protein